MYSIKKNIYWSYECMYINVTPNPQNKTDRKQQHNQIASFKNHNHIQYCPHIQKVLSLVKEIYILGPLFNYIKYIKASHCFKP